MAKDQHSDSVGDPVRDLDLGSLNPPDPYPGIFG